jgi:two-component system, NtrC family, sensor histidine kinase HydH
MEQTLSHVSMPDEATSPVGHTTAYHYDRALSDLALVLAHRIRGLVASIEGYADLLTDTLITREQRELSLRIIEGATRIERVLADLQLFSEPLDPVRLPIAVHQLMDEVLAPLTEEDRSRISLQISDVGFPELMADPFLTRQALFVLVQNALDATRRGGAVRIEVVASPGDAVQFFPVGNDGEIVSEEPERLVFAPFYTTKAQNMGIGLPLARRIAESQGGRLELSDNSAETGVVFTLSLPRS